MSRDAISCSEAGCTAVLEQGDRGLVRAANVSGWHVHLAWIGSGPHAGSSWLCFACPRHAATGMARARVASLLPEMRCFPDCPTWEVHADVGLLLPCERCWSSAEKALTPKMVYLLPEALVMLAAKSTVEWDAPCARCAAPAIPWMMLCYEHLAESFVTELRAENAARSKARAS